MMIYVDLEHIDNAAVSDMLHLTHMSSIFYCQDITDHQRDSATTQPVQGVEWTALTRFRFGVDRSAGCTLSTLW